MTTQSVKEWIQSGKFLIDRKFSLILWYGLSLFAIPQAFVQSHGTPGNYRIFRQVFYHLVNYQNLYISYPLEYNDENHYGPFFGLIIAPFALLPDWLGISLFLFGQAALLMYAIKKLPFKQQVITTVFVLVAHELMNATSWAQFNQFIGASILLTFFCIEEDKDEWAAFFVLCGAFVKIYTIVGLAFFFFSKKPLKLVLWLAVWAVVFFFLPMLITKPSFLVQCYYDWHDSLVAKAAKNIRLDINNDYQDISVMGMIRRIFHYRTLKDSYVLGIAAVLFASQYIHFKHFKDLRYRLYILCSILIFVVIYSNGAESPTYIIAFPAVCIWYSMQPKTKWTNSIMVFALLVTSFSYSDLLTPWFREHIARPYSIKALPCFIVWSIILVQIWSKQFLRIAPLSPLNEQQG